MNNPDLDNETTGRYLANLYGINVKAYEESPESFPSHRTVSLMEIMGLMDRFNAEDLAQVCYNFGQFYQLSEFILKGVDFPNEMAVTDEGQLPVTARYEVVHSQLKNMGCHASAAGLKRLMEHSTAEGRDKKEADKALELQQKLRYAFIGRLHDELATTMFLSLEMWEADLYESPLEGWKEVVAAFPDTAFEIEEASKCYALNRYDATVFHIMRAVEVGILALLSSINKPMSNGSWGAYIEAIEKHARTQPPPDNKPALEDVAAHLRTVKNAWRNPTMHVENRYSKTEASGIYEASKGLLQSISKAK